MSMRRTIFGLEMTNTNIYLIVSFIGIFLFVISFIFNGNAVATWLVMEHNYDYMFSDHFRHVVYASDLKSIYFDTSDAMFPAFAYIMYYLLYRLNPHGYGISDWKACRDYQYNVMIYVMLTVATCFLLMLTVCNIIKKNSVNKNVFIAISLIFSAPVMAGAIERGNVALFVAAIILIAINLSESDNKIARETALILIAMAAGIKVYPAIMGMIFVREKRYKETIRLIIYGLIFFFVPFAFTGGIAGLIQYIRILVNYGSQSYCSWTNIRNFLLSISNLLGYYEYSAHFVVYFKIIENLYFILCCISLFRTKEKWKYVLYMVGIMALYVPFSYRYVSVYMIIPLIMYLRDQDAIKGKRGIIYSLLFGLVFTIPMYGYWMSLETDFCIFWPIYAIMFYSFVEDWLLRRHKINHEIEAEYEDSDE